MCAHLRRGFVVVPCERGNWLAVAASYPLPATMQGNSEKPRHLIEDCVFLAGRDTKHNDRKG